MEDKTAVEVEEEGQEIEVNLEQNSPVDENPKNNDTTSPEVVVAEEGEKEEELDDYSKRVQKRIKNLTEKYRTEERQKDEAARFAATVKAENDDFNRKRFVNMRDVMMINRLIALVTKKFTKCSIITRL